MRSGTRFWPQGPASLDWTIDLANGSFGPLHLGSAQNEVKSALGRPDNPQFFGTGQFLTYQRFALALFFDKNQRVNDFEIDVPERDDDSADELKSEKKAPSTFDTPLLTSQAHFDPLVKLPGASVCRLRRLTLEDFERAFASYRFDHADGYREWARGDIVNYLDLLDDNRTLKNLGCMKNDES